MAILIRNIIFKPTEIVNYESSNGRYMQSQNYIKFDGNFNGTKRVVSSITISSENLSAYLNTDANPLTPYVPQYPGSPATKKYVDDNIPTKVSDLTNDSNFQTDTQVNQAISAAVSSAYKYKGSVANQAALPASGNTTGDVWNTEDTGMNYAWTGSAWDALGTIVDLSGKQDKLIAGSNIQIASDGKTISAIDTKYTAGTGISIDANNVISNTQTSAEWGNITGTLSDQTDLQNALNTKADKEDVNVKVFHIASTNDLTNAQAAIDRWEQGRLTGAYTPLIEFGGGKELYGLLAVYDGFQAVFTALAPETTQSTSKTTTSIKQVTFSLTGTPGQPQTVTAISTSNYLDINYLDTDASYSSPYTPVYPGSPATKKYVDDNVKTYTAGTNVQISSSNVISAIDTTYNAGDGIEIKNGADYSAIQGPCPTGYHIPTSDEFTQMENIFDALEISRSDGTYLKTYLKMPYAGYRNGLSMGSTGSVSNQGVQLHLWSCTYQKAFVFNSYNNTYSYTNFLTFGLNIRPFKDDAMIPDSNWVALYQGSNNSGVYHNSSLGLISFSGDGLNWVTIADKNLGATTVYNNGDALSQTNCGNYYQWGNNYGFPFNGNVTTSTTLVDTTGYGPGNYYNSSTFIGSTGTAWFNPINQNLRGGETGAITFNNAITNTGVLSVNGQTGDVVLDSDDIAQGSTNLYVTSIEKTNWNNKADTSDVNTKTFYLSSTSDLTNAQAAYSWFRAGKNPIVVLLNKAYVLKRGTFSGSGEIVFVGDVEITTGSSYDVAYVPDLRFTISNYNVTAIDTTGSTTNYLSISATYSTPYTPYYQGSPATKKYVDDAVAGAGQVQVSTQTGNILTSGMKIWAGTQSDYEGLGTYDNNTVYLTI